MNDSELTGDDLLKRIDELTGNDVRDPGGGNGWRHLLYAVRREIRRLEHELTLTTVNRDWWKSQCEEAREALSDVKYELGEVEGERDALEDELREARDD